MDTTNQNPFQKLESQEELPADLKSKVIGSIGFGQMVRDFTDLFTAKAGETAIELFNGEAPAEKNDEKSDLSDKDQS